MPKFTQNRPPKGSLYCIRPQWFPWRGNYLTLDSTHKVQLIPYRTPFITRLALFRFLGTPRSCELVSHFWEALMSLSVFGRPQSRRCANFIMALAR